MPRTLPALGLLVVFVVLVGTTIAGIVETWPRHRTIPPPASLTRPKTIGAEVEVVRKARCRVPGAQRCSEVTVRLQGGPDEGKTTSFRFGDTGGNVDMSVGDKVLVYKNPLPANAMLPRGVHLEAYSFADFQRKQPLLWLGLAFALVVVAAGRFHGLRALVGLSLSVATVVFFVVPAIADGRPPLQVAAFGGLG